MNAIGLSVPIHADNALGIILASTIPLMPYYGKEYSRMVKVVRSHLCKSISNSCNSQYSKALRELHAASPYFNTHGENT